MSTVCISTLQGAPKTMKRRPRIEASLLLAVVFILCASQVKSNVQVPANSHGSRARLRAEEFVCCPPGGSSAESAAKAATLAMRPSERCCGRGWGLHCCEGSVCCLEDTIVPRPGFDPSPGHEQSRDPDRLSLRDSMWKIKNWAQWLNLAVVIMVTALVCAVLVCCWRRDRSLNKQRLLDYEGLYCYGAVTGHHPSAPHWNSPMTSRWMDFAYKQPIPGTPLRPTSGPFYQAAPRVNPYNPAAV